MADDRVVQAIERAAARICDHLSWATLWLFFIMLGACHVVTCGPSASKDPVAAPAAEHRP